MTKNKKLPIIAALTFISTCALAGALEDLQENAKVIISKQIDHSSIFVTAKNGKINFGTASDGVNPDTLFCIGSVSKQMTAFMMLKTLSEKYPGKNLEELLNEKLGGLFEKSQFLQKYGEKWKNELSAIDLLTHRSGLSNYTEAFGEDIEKPYKIFSKPTDVMKYTYYDPKEHGKFKYCNTGFYILAKLLEEENKAPLNKIFDEQIAKPAGMTRTFCPTSGAYDVIMKEHANNAPDQEKEMVDMANVIGAGSVISAANDMIKWIEFFYEGPNKIIRDTMLKNYDEPEKNDFTNLGLFTRCFPHQRVTFHNGSIGQFNSYLCCVRGGAGEETTVAFLTNSDKIYEEFDEASNEFLCNPPLSFSKDKWALRLTRKFVQENESLKFAKKYNEENPGAQEQGYGPFAIVPYMGKI